MKRLLLVMSIALMASLLVFGWAGTAYAHSAHDVAKVEQPDRSHGGMLDHRSDETRLPCHCQGSITCVQLIEAPRPLLLTLEQELSSDLPVFEQKFERSVLVPTDPPPPGL